MMKTAEEILENIMCCTIEEEVDLDVKSNYYYQHDYVVKVIEQAQKESYNQAIDDAVNSVKVVNTKKLNFETGRWENVPLIDQTSILKLKK